MILLNMYKYGSDEKTFYAILMMVNYHTIFEAQGIVNQVWREKLKEQSDAYRATVWQPAIIYFTVFSYSIVLPGPWSDVGFVFFYPIYGSTIHQSLYTCGSWLSIYVIEWHASIEWNKRFGTAFDFIIESSLFLYLAHDLWIAIVCSLVIVPLHSLDYNLALLAIFESLAVIGLSHANFLLVKRLFAK